MYKNDGIHIRRTLREYINKAIITADKSVIVFGVSDFSREIIDYLKNQNISVKYVLDNDERKAGSYCKGVRVISPKEIVEENYNSLFIVCSDLFSKEMISQLLEIGVSRSNIFQISLSSNAKTLKSSLAQLKRGKRIYSGIRKQYPQNKIFLCPYTGTGDIYLIGTFLQQYIKKNNINDFVLIVVSKACAMVADIFTIKNIVIIDGEEDCHSLIRYYMTFPEDNDITVLNDSWRDIYTNPVQWIRGLYDMNFAEMFRRFVFFLDEGAIPEHPVFKNVDSEIDSLFRELDLADDKTVIIAPYSNTLADVPPCFWESLACKLNKLGYTVCTNCGSDDELPIKGTERLFFPLNIAPQVISRAGYFIGIRSGFCDIISGADAKKIVLYDKSNYFINCTAFDYFSLKKMGLSDDVIELQFDNTDLDELEKLVLKEFC